jgi:hypothetical protein
LVICAAKNSNSLTIFTNKKSELFLLVWLMLLFWNKLKKEGSGGSSLSWTSTLSARANGERVSGLAGGCRFEGWKANALGEVLFVCGNALSCFKIKIKFRY